MSAISWPKKVLIFAPSVDGGIPHYTHHQAEELVRRGIDVTMVCRPDHPWPQDKVSYRQIRRLSVAPTGRSVGHKVLRVLTHIWIHYQLFWWVLRLRPSAVLIEANTEFYAAAWAWPHLAASALGLPYIMNLHDPVRGLWFGPKWFSRLSLWAAYRLLWGGLIHGQPPKGAYLPKSLAIEVVPHGLFDHLEAATPPYDLRRNLGITAESFVLLSFGHIADRKNQQLLVEAVARVPKAVLVIAGPQHSTRQRPPQFYRDQASALGCADRVYVLDQFIPDEEVAAYFAAADAIALTYDSGFVSQSGVLQIAAQWEKPVLASSGPGALRETMGNYGIGIFVPPDSADAIEGGLRQLISAPGGREAAFAAFRTSASWGANIDGMLHLLRRLKPGKQISTDEASGAGAA